MLTIDDQWAMISSDAFKQILYISRSGRRPRTQQMLQDKKLNRSWGPSVWDGDSPLEPGEIQLLKKEQHVRGARPRQTDPPPCIFLPAQYEINNFWNHPNFSARRIGLKTEAQKNPSVHLEEFCSSTCMYVKDVKTKNNKKKQNSLTMRSAGPQLKERRRRGNKTLL